MKLSVMLALSFVVMYAVMYSTVDALDNVFLNVSRVYMTGLMVAPMAVIAMVVMGAMYPDKKRNLWIAVIGIAASAACFWAIRAQAAVGDRQFLRAMIPHHSGAILMCDEADLSDPEIQALCRQIVKAQKEEIAMMKRIMRRLDEE